MISRCSVLLFAAVVLTAACSKKTEPTKAHAETEEKENDEQPREEEIAEDCVAFVQATKVATPGPAADCPGCSANGSHVLVFQQMRVDRVSCSANSCEVTVTLRTVFNPGPPGTITGGLTAWISQEQRLQYSNGHPPEGEQVYQVKIIYKRSGDHWRAIEFDKADPQ